MGNFSNFDLFCVPVATTIVNTCQPPPPVPSYPQVLHRLSKVVDNFSLPVDNFGGNIGMVCAWVDKCVDLCWTLELAQLLLRDPFISRAHATSMERHWQSIVQMCEYLL